MQPEEGGATWRCDTCLKLFHSSNLMVAHKQVCRKYKRIPNKCRECGKSFPREKQLRRHLNSMHKNKKTVPCPECPKLWSCDFDLKQHIQRVHLPPKVVFQCDTCGDKYKNKHSLICHQKSVHLKEFTACCDVCGKGFVNVSQLKTHRKTVHENVEVRMYTCPVEGCGKSFRQKYSVKYHRETVHADPKQVFRCEQCGKTLSHPDMYRRHVYKHSRRHLTYSCIVCHKSFTSNESLTVHMRIHTGEKPFVCEYCGKSFSAKKFLVTHVRTHTKEKPFACTFCEKRFTQRGTLSLHLKKNHVNETSNN